MPNNWLSRLLGRLRRRRDAARDLPTVSFDSDAITWSCRNKTLHILPWREITLIGYATNDSGPWGYDWFLVFADGAGTQYHVALADAWPGAEDLHAHVVTLPGVVLGEKGCLVNSTDNDSVVVWPPERAGEPLPET